MRAAAAGRARAPDAAPRSKGTGHSRPAHKRRPLEQRILLTATLCLLAFGAVMVYSASSATTLLQGQGNGSGYLIKYLAYGAVGLVVMHALARRRLDRAQALIGPLLAVSFVLVLAVHVPHVGVSVNGAKRWIGAGVLQFEPSELMKLALLLYTATLLARNPGQVHDLRALAKPLLTVVGGACALIVIQPDLGTGMVIVCMTATLLVAAGIPLRKLGVIAAALAGMVFMYALVQPYARARFTSFIDPWAHASGSGFQAVQGQIAIGSGGLLGAGPGQSVQKIFYLPEAPSDFILAVIAEELGAVGVFALLFLYGMIAYAGLSAARKARSTYAALMAVGATSLIISQALLNTFAVLGMAPLTGVPLPFVSYGSSSLIVMLAAMGLLLNVAGGPGAHLRAVPVARRRRRDAGARESQRWSREQVRPQDRDRSRRDGGTRRAGAGGRRGAAR